MRLVLHSSCLLPTNNVTYAGTRAAHLLLSASGVACTDA